MSINHNNKYNIKESKSEIKKIDIKNGLESIDTENKNKKNVLSNIT